MYSYLPEASVFVEFFYFLFFFLIFSTGLVRLYIGGLPLRSCRTIGAPSVQGSAQCAFFAFLVAAGFEPTSLSLGGGRFNCYPILTPRYISQVAIGIPVLAMRMFYVNKDVSRKMKESVMKSVQTKWVSTILNRLRLPQKDGLY